MILDSAIQYFTRNTRALACMAIACGTAENAVCACDGSMNLQGDPVKPDSIYDLASLTKLFTGLLIMRLYEAGQLDLDAPIAGYAPQFIHLDSLTVRQAAWFQRTLKTPERIDQAASRDEALKLLFSADHQENGRHAYSDIPAMVLKYVLEAAGGLPYMELLRREILDPLGMKETFCLVPEALRPRCVSTDREHRIEKGRYIVRDGILPGTPHDPKARILEHGEDDCPGHAGLFSTVVDLIRLCQGVLSGRVVSPETLRMMARNYTGHRMPDGTYSQCLGCQCYVRHPDQHFSETPAYMSDTAIAWSGFTGNHLGIDFEQGIFEFYLGSRVLNRVSVIIPDEGKTLADYGLNRDGTGVVQWPGGDQVISSVQYVYLKDEHLHPLLGSVLEAMKAKR